MSTVTAGRTPAEMAAEADRILAEAGSTDEAAKAGKVYSAVLNGDLHPYDLPAEDRGWWDTDDLLPQALEWAADQYLLAAETARRRLGEYQKHKGEK